MLLHIPIPRLFHPGYKVVAWLLQPPFTTLLLGCHKVVTTRYPACYSFNSKVVSPRVQGCCMVVTTYFHKLVARLLLPCDKVVAWLLQPWHFYMGTDSYIVRMLLLECEALWVATCKVIPLTALNVYIPSWRWVQYHSLPPPFCTLLCGDGVFNWTIELVSIIFPTGPTNMKILKNDFTVS